MAESSRILSVNDANFDELVLNAPGVVVVDFWAPWCPPCKFIKPFMPKLALDFEGRVTVAEYNRDEGRQVFDRFELSGIPNIVAFKNGEIIGSVVGGREYPELRQAFIAMLSGHAEPRAIVPELEEFFTEAVAEVESERAAVVKPFQEAFAVKSEPVYARIKPPFNEVVRAHNAGEIDDAAYEAAQDAFEAAFKAELGADYAVLEAACQKADAEREEQLTELVATFAEMSAEIYDVPADDTTDAPAA